MKGKLNILGVQMTDDGAESTNFRLKASKGFFGTEWIMIAPNIKAKNTWISVLFKAKEQTTLETEQLLKVWKQQEECISCIAALAAEQAEKEEQQNPFQTDDQDEGVEERAASALDELFGLSIASLEGQAIKMGEAMNKPLVVLALLRHFG